MNTNTRPATRCALVTAALLGVAALTGTSAAADSGEVEYSCEFGVPDPADPDGPGDHGEGTTTASFDTAIPDGLVVDVGKRVNLDPFTGTITLPEAFVTMLREAGLTSVEGEGGTDLLVDPTDDALFASFQFGPSRAARPGSPHRRGRG